MTALKFHDRNRNRGIHKSTALVNVAYKRSWRDIFTTNSQRRQKTETRTQKRKQGDACGK